MSDKIKLLLLFGGQSCEHEVSVTSAGSVLDAIDRQRYELILAGISKQGRWVVPENPDEVFERGSVQEKDGLPVYLDYTANGGLKSAVDTTFLRPVDVVFPLLHGPRGEDGALQGLLELAGLAYVGSGVVGSAVGMDKEMMRRAFVAEGLDQTPWRTVRAAKWRSDAGECLKQCMNTLVFPMFVKPCSLGSSVGITKVHDEAGLRDGIETALRFDYKAMVEQSVENADEIECAVLGNEHPEASPLGEIVPGAEFYNYETKYLDDKSQLVIPARIDSNTTTMVRNTAIRVFRAVEAFGLARVDFLLERDGGRVFVNEINTIPGFTPISMYPKLWQAAGLSYSALISRLIELALERQREKNRYTMSL